MSPLNVTRVKTDQTLYEKIFIQTTKSPDHDGITGVRTVYFALLGLRLMIVG